MKGEEMLEIASMTKAAACPISLQLLRAGRAPIRNTYQDVIAKAGVLDRVALFITQRVGTMGFFLVILVWTVLWLGWNLAAPAAYRFDPPMGFVFWLFISNLIQILLMPLIMVGQNLQGAHAEARAQNDLEINMQAEAEVEVVLEHLEYQNTLLLALVRKLEVEVGAS